MVTDQATVGAFSPRTLCTYGASGSTGAIEKQIIWGFTSGDAEIRGARNSCRANQARSEVARLEARSLEYSVKGQAASGVKAEQLCPTATSKLVVN